MALTRWTPDDSGGFYSETGYYVPWEEVEELLRDVALFLEELPQDLGRGSLNGWKVQLQQKIADND